MTEKTDSPIIPLLVVLALAAALAGLWYIQSRQGDSDSPHASAPADCDLQQSRCRADFGDGRSIELSLSPRPIRTLATLRIEVRTQGLNPRGAEVDFSGVEMYMGYNRPKLAPTGEAGVFAAPSMLPLCVEDSMTWHVQVLLDTPEGPVRGIFKLSTTERGRP
ncbi:MAG: hypothetical protein PHI49_11025 [Halothiobacillaceae bacterium]|nr:hypothetical protein [Halothiobacillaceae bacterium]